MSISLKLLRCNITRYIDAGINQIMISLHSYGSTVVISNRKPVGNTVYPAFSFTVTSEGIATDWIINSMHMLFYFSKWGIIKVSKSGKRFCDTLSNKSKL